MGRDRIFLSYSRDDGEIFDQVKQKLLDRGLGDRLWDDSKIQPGALWDQSIQAAMDATAVAVLILSDHFFKRREGGRDYVLERELPYFLEHRQQGDVVILQVYWRPSNHYAPDVRDTPGLVQPFTYRWGGQACSFLLHDIQDANRGAPLFRANEPDRLDALLKLAHSAEGLLAQRLAKPTSTGGDEPRRQGHTLAVDLAIAGPAVERFFRVRGEVVPVQVPPLTRGLIAGLKSSVGQVADEDGGRLGAALYEVLFGPEGHNRFPKVAETAWDLTPAPQANTLACTIQVRCDAMAEDPWPLDLPWNLTAFRGEALAEHCGWAFEAVPPGQDTRRPQALSPEPPLLLLYDEAAPGALRHVGDLRDYLDRTYAFAADAAPCGTLDQVARRLAQTPEPEVLYVYAGAGLDLNGLAAVLGTRVPLLVLNLLGERPPRPPAALVRERKVILALHPTAWSERAREAGHRWLQTFLEGAGKTPWQRPALAGFGPGVRLWSGCGDLSTQPAQARGDRFRRTLIKLLLDRVTARSQVSDQVATALSKGLGVLGLIAAGTRADHPGLLPAQVWHHYQYVREAGSRDSIRRREIPTGEYPAADELHYRLADQLGVPTRDWEDALDRLVGDSQPGDRTVVSLEWQVPPKPLDIPAQDWRQDWLAAWLDLGTQTLAQYRRTGVLIVHSLLIEAPDPGEALAWCEGARDLYRSRVPTLSETGRRFFHHRLAPLSEVPEEDIETFFDLHYRLRDHYPDLAPYTVARWVHEQTGGDFAATVALVERLHDTGFQAAPKTVPPEAPQP